MNILLKAIEGQILNVIYGIAGLVGTFLLSEGRLYLKKKKEAEILKIGIDTYNSRVTVAKNVFFQVQQLFKLIPGAGDLKASMFDKILLTKFPMLTQLQIDHFREAAVGKINIEVTDLLTPVLAPAFDPAIDESNVKIEPEIITPQPEIQPLKSLS